MIKQATETALRTDSVSMPLSVSELRAKAGKAGAFCTASAGQAALRDLGLRNAVPQFVKLLDSFAECMRPFDFGFYRNLGYLKRSEDGLLPVLKLPVAGQQLEARYVGSGYFALVFKLSGPGTKSYALKVFYQRPIEYLHSGPWNETATGLFVTENKVSNMPHLCLANPRRGWILSEFVDKDFRSSTPNGPTWADLDLMVLDGHKDKENQIAAQDGRAFRVDYGHLRSLRSLEEEPSSKIRERLDTFITPERTIAPDIFIAFYKENPAARLVLLQNLALVPPADRTDALEQMSRYEEADFFPFQDYLTKGVIPYSDTRKLFEFKMKHADPLVRGQAIFDLSRLSKEDSSYLGQRWYTLPEFAPFMIYLGQKSLELDYPNAKRFL